MYKMLQTASQVNLEMRVVVQYIIEGIPDEAVNKSVRYGAKTIKQLKERCCQCESMKREAVKPKLKASERNDKPGRTDDKNKNKVSVTSPATKTVKRCFNCGADDHLSSGCLEKEKGKKCFKCSKFGHISAECQEKSKDVYVVSRPRKEKYHKIVTINDCKSLALVNTESDLTLICVGVIPSTHPWQFFS